MQTGLPAACAGIGLRSAHFKEMHDVRPDIGFLEVHPENFFGGGLHVDLLCEYAACYPLSFHGVGLSLGSTGPLDARHIQALKRLTERIHPAAVSEHLAWSRSGNAHLPDLLPLPYTAEALAVMVDHVAQVQDALGRKIFIENPSAYLAYAHSTMSEPEFLAELVERSGCGLLLDVNNLYVQCHNLGAVAEEYFRTLDSSWIAQMHLAGHTPGDERESDLLIDTHDAPVCDAVWALFTQAVERWGASPTTIEWDRNIPALSVLLDEAQKAQRILSARMQNQEAMHATG